MVFASLVFLDQPMGIRRDSCEDTMVRFSILFTVLVGLGACSPKDPFVAVGGQCSRSVTPDRGVVTLVAQVTDKNGQLASQKATELYEQVRASVQKLELKDLEMQTSEYSIHEMVDYQGQQRVSRGMRASIGLQVTTSEIARLGDVTALASQLPIERVDGLSTFLSREATQKAQEECLKEAVQNAQVKAEKLAQAAGAQLGKVLMIDETPASQNRPPMENPMYAMKASDAGSESAQLSATVEAKREVITVNVLVKFALK